MSDTKTETVAVDTAPPVDANAAGLAAIAAKLAELGHAPEGDYDIAEQACGVISGLTSKGQRLDEELAACCAERDGAQAQVAALQADVERAQKAPRASAGAKAAKARRIGPDAVKDPVVAIEQDGARKEAADVLLGLIREAGVVEVAFSNGKTEIAGLEPVQIHGDAWRVGVVGLQLTIPELLIHGPGLGGGGSYALQGYGLFLDGELAAYRDRGDTLTVGAGAQMNIAPDIVF